ncbi:AraC family transcriptional regulator [Marinobacter nanhaiticus D15-8W]|uniref:AraC family transcriptional regulator n=1 Tax=Marinobacter nanhaiticus D15-8W TaxID=626887 RepID=N6W6V1_9GAMM|nr:AraC family transcriptional regulator [Marinobacter nanhaiticus]ENO15989.1 AraC family transcriptional regulator [Marinobacter nanhaiticus D15-8W]BES73152.1 AraC family transcriptional regulator [Marinobacter nanhaiticus D15-8W]
MSIDSVDIEQRGQRMVSLLAQMAPREGYNLTALPDVRFLRSNRPLNKTPVLYDPGIVIVCQGRKRGYWGSETYIYDAQHYLAVSIPVPFTMETEASETKPLLAIYLHLDIPMAAELLLELQEQDIPAPTAPCGMVSSVMEPALGATVERFLDIMAAPDDSRILGPAMVREIYYRVLTGAQGGAMRAALDMEGNFGRISRSIRRIHLDYAKALDVSQLAGEASMSVPSFHAHFRQVTQTSPMQYVKAVRLHQARLLMFRNSMTAAAASLHVGYESTSQFSREFRRLFGRSPREEVAWMRSSFELPPPASPSIFVSSH